MAPRNPQPKKWADAIARVAEGASLVDTADEINVHPFTLYQWLPKEGDWSSKNDELIRLARDLLVAGETESEISARLGFRRLDQFHDWLRDSLPDREDLSVQELKEIERQVKIARDSGHSIWCAGLLLNLNPTAIDRLKNSQGDPATGVLLRFEKLLDAVEENLNSEHPPDRQKLRIIQGVLQDKDERVREDFKEVTDYKNFSLLPKEIRDKYNKLMERFNQIRLHPMLVGVPPELGENLQSLTSAAERQGRQKQDKLPRSEPGVTTSKSRPRHKRA
jgi:hypothetical protein